MSTIDDYNAMSSELAALRSQEDKYSGNNPNKYRASIADTSARLRAIETELKAAGVLRSTEQEELERQLDLQFRDARNKEVVEFNGRRFVRRFTPIGMSLSGKTVKEWGKSWEELPP
jgi:hypothetical protein